jgi:hypothetical protein
MKHVQRAMRRSALIATLWLTYRLALPPLDHAGLLTQMLAPSGAHLVAFVAVAGIVLLRLFLVIVAPLLLMKWWVPVSWRCFVSYRAQTPSK